MPARKLSRRESRDRLVEVGVKVPLTAAELRRLRDLAAADLRSVAGYVA